MKKLVYGVGNYEAGKFKRKIDKKETKESQLWTNMLARCYGKNVSENRPSYENCTVSDNFKNFQYFAEWCQDQVGFGIIGFQLDKDILVKGNKIYSEDTCVFIPRKLNLFLTKREANRGEFPIGVTTNKKSGRFVSVITNGNSVQKNLGYFDTPEEAFLRYKLEKEKLAKHLAEAYKDVVDIRVVNALNSYVVQIND